MSSNCWFWPMRNAVIQHEWDGWLGYYHGFLNDVGDPWPLGDGIELDDLFFCWLPSLPESVSLLHPTSQEGWCESERHGKAGKEYIHLCHFRELCMVRWRSWQRGISAFLYREVQWLLTIWFAPINLIVLYIEIFKFESPTSCRYIQKLLDVEKFNAYISMACTWGSYYCFRCN